jgi:hypothetical protein
MYAVEPTSAPKRDVPDHHRAPAATAGAAPPRPDRWLPQRKAEVIAAVDGGVLSLDDALERYALTIEEYLSWQRGIREGGLAGLRVYTERPMRNPPVRNPKIAAGR